MELGKEAASLKTLRPIERAKKLNELFYWWCFSAGMGDEFHSFLEFNGLMSTYIQVVENSGVDTSRVNTHCAEKFKVMDHDLDYLAEKLSCIFTPMLRGMSKQQRSDFISKLAGLDDT